MTFGAAQREFLDRPRFAVVATVGPDHLPHQTVMWFMRDGPSGRPAGDARTAELLARDRVSLRLHVDHVHSSGLQ